MGYVTLPNGLRLHDGDWAPEEEFEFYDRQRSVVRYSRPQPDQSGKEADQGPQQEEPRPDQGL